MRFDRHWIRNSAWNQHRRERVKMRELMWWRWFAWYPVKITTGYKLDYRWLEFVWRCGHNRKPCIEGELP